MTVPPIHRARGVVEWLDEYENEVNHMLWPSQECLLETWCSSSCRVQTLVESVPRCTEAVLVAHGGLTPY
uniref:Uncharacterized protein n=1 Tax=Monopterus albus TaxID=43700 RepID=A0A3Q3IML7_MONAL